jgi:AraC-like DNA-binding protein
VIEMNRQHSSAQSVMHTPSTATFRHAQGSRHGPTANRPTSTRQLSDSPFEQACTAHDANADVVARLLQQALNGAQQLQHSPNIRVVEHLRLAIHAHAEVCPQATTLLASQARSEGLASWQAALAQKLILEQLDASVLTATLARACSLSRGHFSRLFKRTFGLPPHKWQRERRLDMAKQLLTDSRCALADIAIQCGFNDQAHFTRVFKMLTQQTPAAWRRIFGCARQIAG